jgi:hypothetical protein
MVLDMPMVLERLLAIHAPALAELFVGITVGEHRSTVRASL